MHLRNFAHFTPATKEMGHFKRILLPSFYVENILSVKTCQDSNKKVNKLQFHKFSFKKKKNNFNFQEFDEKGITSEFGNPLWINNDIKKCSML